MFDTNKLKSINNSRSNSNQQQHHNHHQNSGVALWKQPHYNRKKLTAQTPGSMVYNCDICGKAFGYLFSMKKHREKHAPFIPGSFQPSFAGEEHHLCVQCNRLFSCYASLKRHQLTTHTENGPVFHCPYCPYSNPFSWQVKRHIYKRHGFEESFFCGSCKKFFRSDSERERHNCTAQSRFKQQQNKFATDANGNNSTPNSNNGDNNSSNNNQRYYDDAESKEDIISVGEEDVGGVSSRTALGASNSTSNNDIDDVACKLSPRDKNSTDMSAGNVGVGDTPCICADCGTCLPCFEAMVKHQVTHHPSRVQNLSLNFGHDNTTPTSLVVPSRLHGESARRRQLVTAPSRDQTRSRSPLGCESSASVRGFDNIDSESSNIVNGNGDTKPYVKTGNSQDDQKYSSRSNPSLLLPGSNTGNLLLTTANNNEPGSSYSPASIEGTPNSSPATKSTGFECSFCGISFLDPALWGLHTTMHDVNDLRKCNFCGRQAKDKYDFWRHFIDHNKVPSMSLATPPISSNSGTNVQPAVATSNAEPVAAS